MLHRVFTRRALALVAIVAVVLGSAALIVSEATAGEGECCANIANCEPTFLQRFCDYGPSCTPKPNRNICTEEV